jgi:hypothetical protein
VSCTLNTRAESHIWERSHVGCDTLQWNRTRPPGTLLSEEGSTFISICGYSRTCRGHRIGEFWGSTRLHVFVLLRMPVQMGIMMCRSCMLVTVVAVYCRYYAGMTAGTVAVVWGCFMVYRAWRWHNRNEIFTGSSQLLWLIANLWWMSGELHDWQFRKMTNIPILYPDHTIVCGYILQMALAVLCVYYIFMRPMHIKPPSLESVDHYNETGLNPPFPGYFATWREYENCHILFWLCTDYAWNTLNQPLWIITGIPTILIAADFVVSSFREPRLMIDHYHYLAQFLWFSANFIWAYGELFDPQNDYPYSLFASDPNARLTCRWWSSWCLVTAYVPIIVLKILWIAKTRRLYREHPDLVLAGQHHYQHHQWYPEIPILPVVANLPEALDEYTLKQTSARLNPVEEFTDGLPVPPLDGVGFSPASSRGTTPSTTPNRSRKTSGESSGYYSSRKSSRATSTPKDEAANPLLPRRDIPNGVSGGQGYGSVLSGEDGINPENEV